MKYPRYATIKKEVGETPLEALERLRLKLNIPANIPLAYAGRLDPMASGRLLILIGDECKKQKKYHSLDKEYEVKVILGMSSDSGDVLGLVKHEKQLIFTVHDISHLFMKLLGRITLPYPHFSSKTVRGKPLHTWTLEGRLGEIEVPTKTSLIYKLTLTELTIVPKEDIVKTAQQRIESIPEVTDPRKALGADFRREKVRATWRHFEKEGQSMYQVLVFTCIASSGTYMRSLAEHIGNCLGSTGLALSIHRTKIGRYMPISQTFGFWLRRF